MMKAAAINSSGRQNGFSLVEVMVAIAIVAILASIAAPSFNEAITTSKLRSYANKLVASSHLARSEAIKRNAAVRLCASDDGETCAGIWSDGWVVLSADDIVIQRQQAIDSNYSITGDTNTLLFQPTGLGSTQATITICRQLPEAGNQERVVTISVTGKPTVTQTSTGSC